MANPATPTMYDTRTGRNITIDCPFRPGALSQFYFVQWIRLQADPPGSLLIINSRTSTADGFEVLSNFSLVINASQVEFATTRDRFECTVFVTNPPTNQLVYVESNSNNRIQVKTFSKCGIFPCEACMWSVVFVSIRFQLRCACACMNSATVISFIIEMIIVAITCIAHFILSVVNLMRKYWPA